MGGSSSRWAFSESNFSLVSWIEEDDDMVGQTARGGGRTVGIGRGWLYSAGGVIWSLSSGACPELMEATAWRGTSQGDSVRTRERSLRSESREPYGRTNTLHSLMLLLPLSLAFALV